MDALSPQLALITGGGTGVGRATALELAKRGYDIVVNYSRSEKDAEATAEEIRGMGRQAWAIQADVSNLSAVQQMAQEVSDLPGELAIVVSNAATTSFIDLADLDSVTADVWNNILQVNVLGAFWVCQQTVPLMKKSGGGAIVNVSSMAAVTGAGSCLPYAASKGAMVTMTKSLARGLAPEIRVNAVCPGVIESRWLADHREMIDSALEITPLGKPSLPADVAGAICYLACEADMMTGQLIQMDGGRTI